LAGETPAPRELLVSLNIALIFVHPPDLVIIGEVKCTPTYMGHTMSEEKSVSHWIAELQHGNREAAQHLWEKYFTQIVRFAAQKLRGSRRRAVDEEDVALSAIHSALRKIEAGEYPRLSDRNDLWRLLMVITARKSTRLIRDECRQKRGGNRPVLTESDGPESEEAAIEQIISREPTPQFAAEMAEQCDRLLGGLRDDDLRRLAILKMEGNSNEEIAAEMQCATRTIERKLHLIRSVWNKAASSPRDAGC
jgi:DNA-directed RNA polymerase specialized sigma24 family protein